MTLAGFILIPVGLAAFIFSREWLYRLLVFSLPFSATAVINVGSGDSISAIQPWMFFGSLWLLRELCSNILSGSLSIDRKIILPCSLLIGFLAISGLSLFMPLLINGSLLITSPILLDNSASPLFFSTKHITAFLYLVLGVLISLSVGHHNLTRTGGSHSERIYLGACAFVAAWGLFQALCYASNLPYPTWFNNSGSPYAQGYLATFGETGFARVSSVAVEPSILSQVLLTALPLTIPALLKRRAIFSITKDRVCFAVLALALVISTSTVAYVGMAAMFILAMMFGIRMRLISWRTAAAGFAGLAVVVSGSIAGIYAIFSSTRGLIDAIILTKAESYSALERLKTISLANGYFQKFPIFGVGWGSVTSHDLVFKLLANTGIVGLACFAIFVGTLFRRGYRGIKSKFVPENMSKMVWLLSFTLLIFTNVISEFAYVFGHFWFVTGIAISTLTLSPSHKNGTEPRIHVEGAV